MREGEGGCSLDRVAAISVSVSASGRLMVLYVRGGQGLRGELGEIGGGISLHITFFCSISPPTSTRSSSYNRIIFILSELMQNRILIGPGVRNPSKLTGRIHQSELL